jgi:hypothetical protein
VPTIMHALPDVQWSRIMVALGVLALFAAAVLATLALAGSDHAFALTGMLGHLQAIHAGTHALADGNPPPPPGSCGGGVGTHC